MTATTTRRYRDASAAWAVDATGSRRRLQAAAWDRWSRTAMAELIGVSAATVGAIQTGARTTVSVREASLIRFAEQVLRARQGPNPGAVVLAWRSGWATWRQWEGRSVDDPAVSPRPALDPDRLRAAAQRAARATARDGWSVRALADLAGVGLGPISVLRDGQTKKSTTVTPEILRKVASAACRVRGQWGGQIGTALHAYEAGWVGWSAWAGANLADPQATPGVESELVDLEVVSRLAGWELADPARLEAARASARMFEHFEAAYQVYRRGGFASAASARGTVARALATAEDSAERRLTLALAWVEKGRPGATLV